MESLSPDILYFIYIRLCIYLLLRYKTFIFSCIKLLNPIYWASLTPIFHDSLQFITAIIFHKVVTAELEQSIKLIKILINRLVMA